MSAAAPDREGPDRDSIIDFLADIFRRRGAENYLGEAVSMSEHMLQAATLAEAEGAPPALVAAALLHDVGHFVSEFPPDAYKQRIDNRHDAAAARLLARFFPPEVVEPIRLHVAAKRYLCAVEPDYRETLSDASVLSLELQGGPMPEAEAAEFADSPHLEAAVRLRRWDDAAKVAGAKTPDFAHFRPVLEAVLA